MLLLLVSILISAARAEWFCSTQSSIVHETSVEACGVGVGETEARARLDAFDQSRLEAVRMGYGKAIQSMRTECMKTDSGYECYRMVRFEKGGSTVTKGGKIHVGMAKADAASVLGTPVSNVHLILPDRTQSFYGDDVCAVGFCYAVFQDGKLVTTDGIKPSLEE